MNKEVQGVGELYLHLLEQLKCEPNFVTDNGELKKWVVAEAARAYSADVISLLLKDELLRNAFFVNVNGTEVFKLDKFLLFVEQKNFLNDGYTQFTQKVGLKIGGKFLNQRSEVELVFPHKDCVLEGGQTKEDQKRQEIFFNEVLAQDEITQLLEPKVLTSGKRYDSEGEHSLECFTRDIEINKKRGVPKDTITDNLIIKGNNLLALHTLKREFAGKVKLIYIDPPYYFVANKSEDTFNYNSNFKLSTWCTFMKNRLEIARDLLSDDGAIFVQISDDGVGELHLILKDIFNRNGQNNFINKITVKTKSPSGFASVNPGVFETAEYILGFAKNKFHWRFNQQYIKSEYDTNYSSYIVNPEDNYENWQFEKIDTAIAKELGYGDKREALRNVSEFVFNQMVAEFALKNKDRVFRLTAINDNAASEAVELREHSRLNPDCIYCLKREDNYDLYVTKAQEIAFYSKKIRNIDGEEVPTMQLTNIWSDISYEGIAKEGNVKLKGGKKPEKLIRRIVEMASNPGDIVLDFFAGSGTTASVVHKLGRQFITCDQLDSQIEMSMKRLKKVVDGDQSGISKLINWRGGGSFVYMELKKYNQVFIDEIESATKTEELLSIWEKMKQKAFFRFNVDMQKFDENIDEFKTLTLDQQKECLLKMLDLNQLYVNRSDMEDETAKVTEEEKRITKNFY